jgi:ADP-dependent NAD(P)H-hydrate dehydratase / NAD(P)H-hydrate epimerase
MENAGRAVATVLHRLYPEVPVVGLVGSGHNGGDALVALRTLRSWGRVVRGILVADRPPEDPLLHGWPIALRPDTDLDEGAWSEVLDGGAVVLDGMLGTGAHGPPRERLAAAIRRMNAHAGATVALDIPSGVDATTGEVAGDAIRADVTIAFGAPKYGSLLHPGRALTGRLIAVEIGFPPLTEADAPAHVVTPEWARERLPGRETDTHKNRVGRVLIVGGQVGMAGAAVLAARAAFAMGAGVVRVCCDPANRDIVQSALPEAMYVAGDDEPGLAAALEKTDAVIIGPGLGTGELGQRLLRRVVSAGSVPLLVDADALNMAAAGIIDLATVGATRSVLITPHRGEMGRLMAGAMAAPVQTVTSASGRFGCAVLFKGAPSLVRDAGGPLLIDTQSSSDLAVAGMGDTLSGACGALMAQGLTPATAGAVGLYVTGRAARLARRGPGLTPSDVVHHIPDALTESGSSVTDLDLPFVLFDADPAD